jgi:DNA polymerase-3 subunit epsilon
MKQIFIDLETTGLNPKQDKIKQLAYIYRVNGKIIKKGNFKNNIYKSFINDLDQFVNKYNKKDKIYLIAYNAKFDSEFLRQLFLNNGNEFFGSYFYNPEICVMNLAAYKLMQKKRHPENFKLSTLCKYFKIKVSEDNLHDALYDITLTKDLFNKLRKI